MNMLATVSAFVLYLGLMIFVGLWYMKKTRTSGDYFLGGRNLGPWMTALSAEASDMSGWLLMGLPGVAYLGGMQEAFWTAAGLAVGTWCNWFFVAKRLRKYTILSGDSITIPEFLSNRVRDRSNLINLVSALFIIIFFTIYAAAGFVACARLFNSLFGIPYFQALLLGIAVILGYTLVGGFLAVCATDSIQGTLMFIGLILVPVIGVAALGGPSATISKLSSLGPWYLNPFTAAPEGGLGLQGYISSFAWGLGYFGMPHILVRFMAIRSNREVTTSRRIAMVWVIIAMAAALLVGAVGRVLLPVVLQGAASETVFIESAIKLFPAFIAGIFLCGILAAAMSTADSQLLVAASAFSRDAYRPFIRPAASEKELLTVSRLTVAGVALVAFFMALDPSSSIFRLVSYAWAGFGATFGPLILLALFWRGLSRNGAVAGLVAGGITVIVWKQLSGGIFNTYEIVPGFIVCLVAAILFSKLEKHKDPEVAAEFDLYLKIVD